MRTLYVFNIESKDFLEEGLCGMGEINSPNLTLGESIVAYEKEKMLGVAELFDMTDERTNRKLLTEKTIFEAINYLRNTDGHALKDFLKNSRGDKSELIITFQELDGNPRRGITWSLSVTSDVKGVTESILVVTGGTFDDNEHYERVHTTTEIHNGLPDTLLIHEEPYASHLWKGTLDKSNSVVPSRIVGTLLEIQESNTKQTN